MKCIVKDCTNQHHQGAFVGDLCKPCYDMLKAGKIANTTSFLGTMTDQLAALRAENAKLTKHLQSFIEWDGKNIEEIGDCVVTENGHFHIDFPKVKALRAELEHWKKINDEGAYHASLQRETIATLTKELEQAREVLESLLQIHSWVKESSVRTYDTYLTALGERFDAAAALRSQPEARGEQPRTAGEQPPVEWPCEHIQSIKYANGEHLHWMLDCAYLVPKQWGVCPVKGCGATRPAPTDSGKENDK